jgi:hypothetical protein
MKFKILLRGSFLMGLIFQIGTHPLLAQTTEQDCQKLIVENTQLKDQIASLDKLNRLSLKLIQQADLEIKEIQSLNKENQISLNTSFEYLYFTHQILRDSLKQVQNNLQLNNQHFDFEMGKLKESIQLVEAQNRRYRREKRLYGSAAIGFGAAALTLFLVR